MTLSRRRLALESELATATGARAARLRSEIEAVTQAAVAQNGGPFVRTGARVTAAAGRDKNQRKKPTQAKQLIDLAHRLYDVVEDQHGQILAVPKRPPRVAMVLRGRGNALSNRLKLDYFERTGSPPSATGITGAIDVLEAQAAGGGRVAVHVRTVRTASGLVVDLGDPKGRTVIVEGGQWRVEASPPAGVVFRRTRMTEALPEPRRGGHVDELRALVNVSEEGWDLVRAWLVLALLPHIPVPIICITGQQGAGKSVLGRALVSLIDPSSAPLRSMPHNLAEWQTTASASRVVGLDNISRIKEEMSDAFCRATTGEGAAKRQLYTDEDLIVQSYRRALLLTSIDPGALKGDLGERLFPVELKRPKFRRGEEEITTTLARRRPYILGALLDLVAEVLARPAKAKNPPRMADAAHVMAAIDRATDGDSLGAYVRGQENVAEVVLESDPLASAVLALMEGRSAWRGTPRQLYEEVLFYWAPEGRNKPGNDRSMSERLNRIAPQLADVYGLVLEVRRGDRRQITLTWAAEPTTSRRVVRVKRRE